MSAFLGFYGAPFLVGFLICAALVYWFKAQPWARRERLLAGQRARRLSRLGGVALAVSFGLTLALHPSIEITSALWGVLAGSLILVGVGIGDDLFDWPAWAQLLGHIAAASAVVLGGVTLGVVSNPVGNGVSFEWWAFGSFMFPEALIIVAWLVVMINAFNWLDGLDGLAPSTGVLATLVLALIALLPSVNQPAIAGLAVILGGTLAGVMVFNWPPAKILLGTAGSTLSGFLIGALAIIAGSKMASTMMVLAVPLIDSLVVLGLRLKQGAPLTLADQRHIHFRLRAIGLSDRQILAVLLGATAVFGLISVVAPTWVKIGLVVIGAAALGWQVLGPRRPL